MGLNKRVSSHVLVKDRNRKMSAKEMILGIVRFGFYLSENKMGPEWKDAKQHDVEEFGRGVLKMGLRYVLCMWNVDGVFHTFPLP